MCTKKKIQTQEKCTFRKNSDLEEIHIESGLRRKMQTQKKICNWRVKN